jgi:hypothetical protein
MYCILRGDGKSIQPFKVTGDQDRVAPFNIKEGSQNSRFTWLFASITYETGEASACFRRRVTGAMARIPVAPFIEQFTVYHGSCRAGPKLQFPSAQQPYQDRALGFEVIVGVDVSQPSSESSKDARCRSRALWVATWCEPCQCCPRARRHLRIAAMPAGFERPSSESHPAKPSRCKKALCGLEELSEHLLFPKFE